MGYITCEGHVRKWDTVSHDIGNEHWILVSKCYTCGKPEYWEVYEDSEELGEVSRIEARLPENHGGRGNYG